MSKNLSTASESNPEVMSEGDKVRAYSTCSTWNSGGDSVSTLWVAEFQIGFGVAPKNVDSEMVCSRNSVS